MQSGGVVAGWCHTIGDSETYSVNVRVKITQHFTFQLSPTIYRP